MVEMESDAILADAQNIDVCFLVVGDPFGSVVLLSTVSLGLAAAAAAAAARSS